MLIFDPESASETGLVASTIIAESFLSATLHFWHMTSGFFGVAVCPFVSPLVWTASTGQKYGE